MKFEGIALGRRTGRFFVGRNSPCGIWDPRKFFESYFRISLEFCRGIGLSKECSNRPRRTNCGNGYAGWFVDDRNRFRSSNSRDFGRNRAVRETVGTRVHGTWRNRIPQRLCPKVEGGWDCWGFYRGTFGNHR